MDACDSPLTEADWRRFLEARLRRPVDVVLTRARRRVILARHGRRSRLELRLGVIFATAPEEVREDLCRWLALGRRAPAACARLDAWIEEASAGAPPARRPRPRPRGRTHDLESIAHELLASELAGAFGAERPPTLTWGARGKKRARHSLRLGSYDASQHLVRVHPVLDQEGVPSWFVRYIVFHELLHALIPPRAGAGGRSLHHPPEYRARERAYPQYAEAQAWQAANLPALLRSARTGSAVSARGQAALVARRSRGARVPATRDRAQAPQDAPPHGEPLQLTLF